MSNHIYIVYVILRFHFMKLYIYICACFCMCIDYLTEKKILQFKHAVIG